MSPKPCKNDPQIKARVKQEMLNAINEYRHHHKLESRAEAIVALIQLGLHSLSSEVVSGQPQENTPVNSNSSDPALQGVTDLDPEEPPSKEGKHAI